MLKEKQEKSNPVEFLEVGMGYCPFFVGGFFDIATSDHPHDVFYGWIF